MEQELYFLRSSEQYLAKELLYYAVGLDETDKDLQNYPELEQYERNFGSYSGDVGVYMIVDNKVAGGAWVRLLADGLAHIDHDTPELTFAVKPEFRNKGIGTAIMNQLFIEVAKVFPQVSLCVSEDNPAIALYERLGFSKVEDEVRKNKEGKVLLIMLKTLDDSPVSNEEPSKNLEEECFRKSFRQRG